ncbi:hypothetical protein [Shewanella surugensis]|uniref:Uncharacterized protein n=1 Tax=Shewanella surugensis TaxID=212020 RepID=A0ABT0L6P3_9GAMM|nr:hypothetical protein [Shewanella surugensis]MCL1123359.1 hypothetical protein [Shewanella surugensis]
MVRVTRFTPLSSESLNITTVLPRANTVASTEGHGLLQQSVIGPNTKQKAAGDHLVDINSVPPLDPCLRDFSHSLHMADDIWSYQQARRTYGNSVQRLPPQLHDMRNDSSRNKSHAGSSISIELRTRYSTEAGFPQDLSMPPQDLRISPQGTQVMAQRLTELQYQLIAMKDELNPVTHPNITRVHGQAVRMYSAAMSLGLGGAFASMLSHGGAAAIVHFASQLSEHTLRDVAEIVVTAVVRNTTSSLGGVIAETMTGPTNLERYQQQEPSYTEERLSEIERDQDRAMMAVREDTEEIFNAAVVETSNIMLSNIPGVGQITDIIDVTFANRRFILTELRERIAQIEEAFSDLLIANINAQEMTDPEQPFRVYI